MIQYVNANLRTIRIPVHQSYQHVNFNPNNIPTLSLSTPLGDDSNSTILDTIITFEEEYTEKDTTLLKKAISTLKPRYRVIMEMISEGKDGKEIADHLNISRQAVSEQKLKAIEKLKLIMNK